LFTYGHRAKTKKGFVKIPKLAMKNMAMKMVMTGMSLSGCEQAYAMAGLAIDLVQVFRT
jgi:hypothetical protein